MKKAILRKYAKLIAVKGAAVRKGQQVMINAELDQPEFVQMLVEECYRAGASKVMVEWSYQPLMKVNYRYRTEKVLCKVEDWEIEKVKWEADNLPCFIHLLSGDPDGLKGINRGKMVKARQAAYAVTKKYSDMMEGKYQWCVAAVPGKKWAKKVFPELPSGKATEKLWEAILETSRVDGDPLKAWDEHNADLEKKCELLNGLDIEKLEYKSKNGTDFTVGLIPEGRFCGGGEYTLESNIFFNPNIPSDEIFTSPKRGEAEGKVYSTMPLSYQGQLIENFWVEFHEGKVVQCGAEKNEDLLRSMISMDEGAAYLGECALVPFDSAINRMGILFYNTLFDENASCHLALGRGYIDTINDFGKYTLDEMHKMGINDSIIHVDFMIGAPDLSIVAHCRDGRKVRIFKDGNFVI